MKKIIWGSLICCLLFHFNLYELNASKYKIAPLKDIIKGILVLRSPLTKVPPSHWGHPGYENLVFCYDLAVVCLILKAAGYQKTAEQMLDYILQRYRIPNRKLTRYMDINRVYGVLKLYKPLDPKIKYQKSLLNAFHINSLNYEGEGQLEFYTTPGPVSFFILALLNVNARKYKKYALQMGNILLAMQDKQGGIRDGDRFPKRIHTEPHIDSYSALMMLYKISKQKKWKKAADKAFSWFKKNVFFPDKGIIFQGIWENGPSKIFATDVYSWTMGGVAGEKIPLKALKKLTHTMLSKALVQITIPLPDKSVRTLILSDFTDPKHDIGEDLRGGYHPMGSVEWLGGVIIALQKNAVRFWKAKQKQTASHYKALAEILLKEARRSFYYLPELKGGAISFYATGQNIEVGHGWRTPYFYVKNAYKNRMIKGGSVISAWPLLCVYGLNPFIYRDNYKKYYNKIPVLKKDKKKAEKYLKKILKYKKYRETVPNILPDVKAQIVEPQAFNNNMWTALNLAKDALSRKKRVYRIESKIYLNEVIKWAKKVVDDSVWYGNAKYQNKVKKRRIGGLIWYPWGLSEKHNNLVLHRDILYYPLLNEVAVAMWGLIFAYTELDEERKAKYWIEHVIKDVPLHQIPNTYRKRGVSRKNLINGYWNILESLEEIIIVKKGTKYKIQKLYYEVLEDLDLSSAKPKVVRLPYDPLKKCFP